MGTTTDLALPYPEGTDLVIGGDDAIQALAQAVENRMAIHEGAYVGLADSSAAGVGSAVDFPGTVGLMNGFTFDGVTLTRTGPHRMFILHVSVGVTASHAGSNNLISSISLITSSGEFAGSYHRVQSSTADLTAMEHVHNVTTPIGLANGDTIHVALGGVGSTIAAGACSLKVYPIGPVHA